MLLALLLVGCFEEEPVACTDLYAWSVTATVSSDIPLENVVGVYTVDGGEERPCQDLTDGMLACGGEEAGHFAVTITADGHAPQTQEVDVSADECHVIGQSLEFALEPVACDASVVSSVEVLLASDAGMDLQNAWVAWEDPATDMAPQPCRDAGGDVWYCAEERAGNFVIRAGADYHVAGEAAVTVGLTADACHVDMETVEIVLLADDC